METKQKTFTVSIPEGKKAVWNEHGILQLVDDKETNEPKDVTERIKTFCDALSELEQRAGRGDCDASRNTSLKIYQMQAMTFLHTFSSGSSRQH